MLIVGALCVCAAITSAALGLRSLSRFTGSSIAPAQLAAAAMLAAGGTMALAAPRSALVLVSVCVGVCIVGALGTVAAGSWQSARYALRREATAVVCGGACAACTLTSASRPCG
jgi:hypothetical protein